MRRKMKEDVADDEEIYREERMRQEVEVEEVDDPCVAVRVVSECEGRAQRADEGRDDVAAVVGLDSPHFGRVHDRSHPIPVTTGHIGDTSDVKELDEVGQRHPDAERVEER